MDKKIFLLSILVLAFLILASGCTQSNNQTNQQNSTTNVSQNTTAQDVVATQSGPSTTNKGKNITITCKVTNKGNHTVSNVKARSQSFDKTLGTINPAETKEFQSVLYIPTDQDVQADFGPNATVPSPFFIGGFVVTFQDAKGSENTINSNSLEIQLV
jgi:hypothetical protein